MHLSINASTGTPPATDWLQQVEEDMVPANSQPWTARCGDRYDPQLVKRSSEWVSECAKCMRTVGSAESYEHCHCYYDFCLDKVPNLCLENNAAVISQVWYPCWLKARDNQHMEGSEVSKTERESKTHTEWQTELTVKCEGEHVGVNLSAVDITFHSLLAVSTEHYESTVILSDGHHTRWQ